MYKVEKATGILFACYLQGCGYELYDYKTVKH